MDTAVILCGGEGTRLGPIGKKLPKTLVNVQGKPILWYIIKKLILSKFKNIILPLGYKGHLIKKFVNKEFKNTDINFHLIETGLNSRISYRISKIIKFINKEHLFLCNGDTILDFNLKSIVNDFFKKKYFISLLTCTVNYPYSVVYRKKNKALQFCKNVLFNKINHKNINNYRLDDYGLGELYSGMVLINKQSLIENNVINFINFEMDFFNHYIKQKKISTQKSKGFTYAMDYQNQVDVADKLVDDFRYKYIKKLKKKLIKIHD